MADTQIQHKVDTPPRQHLWSIYKEGFQATIRHREQEKALTLQIQIQGRQETVWLPLDRMNCLKAIIDQVVEDLNLDHSEHVHIAAPEPEFSFGDPVRVDGLDGKRIYLRVSAQRGPNYIVVINSDGMESHVSIERLSKWDGSQR